MKVPPLLSGLLAAASLWPAPPAAASEILWTNVNTSAAWTTPGNWQGVLPGENDIANFGNSTLTHGELGIQMQSANLPAPGDVRVGAIQILAERTNKDVTIGNGSTSTKGVLTFYGATINGIDHTILSNQSGKNLTIARNISPGNQAMSVALEAGAQNVIQLNGAGNISIAIPISGANSALAITGTGSGQVTLSGTGNTYSGGVVLNAGTLVLAASGAAGTGAVTLNGGTLQIAADLAVNNPIALAASSATYQRLYSNGGAYNSYGVSSSLGGRNTAAALLSGTAGASRTVSASFDIAVAASNDALRVSDVFNLTGTGDDIHVLQLSIAGNQAGYLGWLKDGEWLNAADGNSSTGPLALPGVSGSFLLSGATATADYLGSWGYDANTHSVWAVVDHGGQFAVVPEPASAILAAIGIALALGGARRRLFLS